MGEPAGIGGELTLKAWLGRGPTSPAFVALDDPARLAGLGRRLGWPVPVVEVDGLDDRDRIAATFARALPVLPIRLARPDRPGHADPENAPAVLASIDRAVSLARAGQAAAVVTNPIHKAVLYAAGFAFPGHTEYLAALAGAGAGPPVMMLAGPSLRVVPVTVHLSLRAALDRLDRAAIVSVGRITWRALRDDFGIARPRLAVAGVNPHAGEAGAMGGEDEAIVRPAVEALVADGIAAFGPLPPDTLFTRLARPGFDAALCMYHDQALIPIKTLDFDHTVNVTLGLPFVRTSPDHGTAFDIAGTGRASAASLEAALALAAAIAARRRAGGAPSPG
jgi:4-hydroxythreonine-4-phosphate dehydrogenase